ncbi:peroxiredoxin-like family protein [Kiritimatiellota bacterium B12222]|nr:peroxiredoxin-like family protein [Kiritimatiellota bacterium B12222]
MKQLIFLLLLPFAFSILSAEVVSKAEDAQVIEAGSDVPNPKVTTMEGESVMLDELLNGEPTVLVFYRGGWCPYCNRQLAALQEVMPELKEQGWKLLALSPDQPSELKKTTEKQSLEYSLVSDSQMEAAEAFGIAFQVDQPTVEKYKTYEIDLVKSSGQTHQQLPVPSVFLVNGEGEITYVYSNPNYKERLSSAELLKAAAGE